MVQTITRVLNIVNSCCHNQNDESKKRFKFFLEGNDLEVEQRAGSKLFHACGPAIANAQSPIDARWVDGTTRSEVDAECS